MRRLFPAFSSRESSPTRFAAALVPLLALLGSCSQAQGEPCQVDGDCESNLVCDKSTSALSARGICCAAAGACIGSAPTDSGPRLDAGPPDAGPDEDTGPEPDAGPADAGPEEDSGPEQDAGPADAGPEDAGPTDSGPPADAGGGTDGGADDAG